MIIRAAALVPVPWRNGHGITRDIVTRHDASGLLWQVSIADLDRDAPFSDWGGYSRVFTPLEGAVALAIGAAPFRDCTLLVPVPFDGGAPTRCRFTQPARAFNAIMRKPGTVRVIVQRLAPGDRAEAEVLHCLTGAVQAGADRLDAGDSLLGGTVVAQTAATLIAVSLADRSAP